MVAALRLLHGPLAAHATSRNPVVTDPGAAGTGL